PPRSSRPTGHDHYRNARQSDSQIQHSQLDNWAADLRHRLPTAERFSARRIMVNFAKSSRGRAQNRWRVIRSAKAAPRGTTWHCELRAGKWDPKPLRRRADDGGAPRPEEHRKPRSGREVLHPRWDRGRPSDEGYRSQFE